MNANTNISKDKRFFSVCLELSDRCKVGCPYCLLEEKKEEVSKEQMLNIISVLDVYGVLRYTIGGGEPLDIPYVYDIGKFVKNLNHEVLLRTSACNYIDCKEVEQAFDIVDISIDSYKKETMKICKPNINSDVILDNIKKLSQSHVECRCNILVTQYNYHDIIPTIIWLAENNIRNIRIQKLVQRGKAKAIYNYIYVSDENYSDLLEKAYEKCAKLNINIEEVKSVNSQTLCIVKPNGELYVGTPTHLIQLGDVFNIANLNIASSMVYANQKNIYGVY